MSDFQKMLGGRTSWMLLRNNREHLVASFILLITLVTFYFPWLFGVRGFFDDQLYYAYPGANYLATSLHSGRFPFWICGLRDGMPFYTDLGMSVFYPPAWALTFFVNGGKLSVTAFQWYMILHLFLGGMFTSVYLKEIKCGLCPRIIGALVFIFSGFMSLHCVHPSVIQTVIWMPLILYFVSTVNSVASKGHYALLILSLVMAFLAGFPQVVVYTGYLAGSYWLFLAFQNRKARGAERLELLKGMILDFLKVLGVMITVCLVVAMQYLPAAENWYYSQRQQFGFAQISDLSLPWYYLVHGLVPNLFGASSGDGSGVPFWGFNRDTLEFRTWHAGAWMYWDFGFYASQVALTAVVVLAFNVRRLVRERRGTIFFLAAVPIVLWLMLGRYGGLFNVFYYVVPGFSMFRSPARIGCLLDFSLAVLAAVLVDILLKRRPVLSLREPFLVLVGLYGALVFGVVVFGGEWFPQLNDTRLLRYALVQSGVSVALLFVLFVLLGLLNKSFIASADKVQSTDVGSGWAGRVVLWALVILTFSDLYLAFHKFHQARTDPAEYFSDRGELISQMARLREQEGVFRFAQLRNGKISEEVIFPRNIGCLYPAYEVSEGLTLFTLKDNGFNSLTNDRARLDIKNVRVIANLNQSSGQVSISKYTNSLPRAKFYHDIRAYDDASSLCADLESSKLDYQHQIGVFRADCVETGILIMKTPEGAQSEVHFLPKTPEEYQISYRTTAPGIIFVSESFYPGWVADGGKFRIIRAFGAFKGIVIPSAGSGVITVKFSPLSFKIGLAISLATLVLLVLTYVVLVRRQTKITNNRVQKRLRQSTTLH